ncbi:RNA-binding protein [Methylomonas sp. AM2-LC]|uniref:RNA-binding protein n=1 Tax=Methylomonas sp. AM2-LC TaxID=3153301 RepID=UPI003265BE76
MPDAWKNDVDYLRTEAYKRGLSVTHKQAYDFVSQVAVSVDSGIDLQSARIKAFNNLLGTATEQAIDDRHIVLFVQNIPEDTHRAELQNFVDTALKRLLIFRSGRVSKVEILTLRDKQTLELEFHGLVYVDSKVAGLKAIEKLHLSRFKKRIVTVREFKLRSIKNDNRDLAHPSAPYVRQKRLGDRRRGAQVELLNDITQFFDNPATR